MTFGSLTLSAAFDSIVVSLLPFVENVRQLSLNCFANHLIRTDILRTRVLYADCDLYTCPLHPRSRGICAGWTFVHVLCIFAVQICFF
jgi:hypothetical protein